LREGYGVIVTHLGEPILTIDRSMLSGKADLSKEDADAIRDAGEHLVAFAGPENTTCFACGVMDAHTVECPLNDC
jgi:hypothetical protein